MAAWLVERRLSQVATRLRSLREELRVLDEQVDIFADDADAHAIRALVAETPGAAFEANDALKHATAIRKHRDHVARTIAELEQRQDELLDRLVGG